MWRLYQPCRNALRAEASAQRRLYQTAPIVLSQLFPATAPQEWLSDRMILFMISGPSRRAPLCESALARRGG